jgi:hypothetical protein
MPGPVNSHGYGGISNFEIVQDSVVYPKEGQMRLAEQASTSNVFPLFLAAYVIRLLSELEGYRRKLALRVT